MSEENLMTIREFRSKYGLDEERKFTTAVTRARGEGWRGIRVKTRWSPHGAYVYAERTLLKIARALKIALNQAGAYPQIQPSEYMTIQEFRRLVPGLSEDFSQLVATWCRRHNLLKSLERPRKYPLDALKRFALKEGKQVPELSCSSAIRPSFERAMTIADFRAVVPGLSSKFARSVNNFCFKKGLVVGEKPHKYPLNVLAMFAELEGKAVDIAPQAESSQSAQPDNNNPVQQDLLEFDTTENSDMETEVDKYDQFREQMLAATNETNRLLRELVAIWKGDQQ